MRRTAETVFYGCDWRMADNYDETCDDWVVRIVKRADIYYKDGSQMIVARHRNMPDYRLSLAFASRFGPPDTYYLVTPKNLDIYTECEFGECRYRRSIEHAQCCDFVRMMARD